MGLTENDLNAAIGKIPPHSLELEMNLLGGMLIDNSLIDNVISEEVRPDFFYRAGNAEIFKAMIRLHDKNHPVDLITLTEEMKVSGTLDSIGGPYYLTELTTSFASSESIGYSIERLKQYFLKRDMINVTSAIRDKAFDPMVETVELLDDAQKAIIEVAGHLFKKEAVRIGEKFVGTMEWAEANYSHTGISGVPSGYNDLDDLTAGFQRTELIVIAARPSHGKSALALCCARNAAIDYQTPVGMFSIEMSTRELTMRAIASEAKIDIMNFKRGTLSVDDTNKIVQVTGRKGGLSEAPIFIDDTSPLTILQFRARARKMKKVNGIKLIIVDYLQLMSPDLLRNRNYNRTDEVGLITRGLKETAKELDIPVIAISQLSRKVEDRGKEKRPQLSDLRESGNIEQDSDVVIFINRPEMYMSKDDVKYADVQGLAEIIVAKQRNGPVGEFKLRFRKSCAKFENLAREQEPIRKQEEIF